MGEPMLKEAGNDSYATAARIALELQLAEVVGSAELLTALADSEIADLIEQAAAVPSVAPAAFTEDRP